MKLVASRCPFLLVTKRAATAAVVGRLFRLNHSTNQTEPDTGFDDGFIKIMVLLIVQAYCHFWNFQRSYQVVISWFHRLNSSIAVATSGISPWSAVLTAGSPQSCSGVLSFFPSESGDHFELERKRWLRETRLEAQVDWHVACFFGSFLGTYAAALTRQIRPTSVEIRRGGFWITWRCNPKWRAVMGWSLWIVDCSPTC